MTNRLFSLWGAFLFAVVSPASAGPTPKPTPAGPPPDIHFLNERGEIVRGVRCAARKPTKEEMARVEAKLAAFRKPRPTPTATPGPPPGPGPAGEIPVAFHVIYKQDRRGSEGNVPEWQLDAQVDVLNAALAGSGFSFYKASVDRTNHSQWFTGCYSQDAQIKQALAIDPAHVLNIYTCKPSGGILGWAYYPWSFPETDYRHGVMLLYSSLPGGTAAPYNEGDTGTHEVGHYLGLAHTFENGCSVPGDWVSDTPYEASPAYGCPVGRDSCSTAGLDPIRNFMDYTDDPCMYEFSGGQVDRMQAMTELYRPSLQ
jgi:hypothetical protein